MNQNNRCSWCGNDKEYIYYHDNEWGVPLHGDRELFELLTLEGAQAGLSWLTILRKRQNYKQAFKDFNVQKIALLTKSDIEKLLNNEGIIRNKLKILSVVKNAQVVLEIEKEFGSLDNFLWKYVDNKSLSKSQTKKATTIAKQLSSDLKSLGMNFVGPTIVYAFMQSSGMINDHEKNCFRSKQILRATT
jgi:DNA-3-methyladenine glycosylase I